MKPIRVVRWVAFVMISGALSFLLAGDTDNPRLWAWLALYWGIMLFGLVALDPELVKERLKTGQKTADPVVLAALRGASLVQVVMGILDIGRFHWSDTVPVWLSVAGWVAAAAGFLFALTAMRANRFFMPSVRIQEERGHRVIDTGPYHFVRHPGYAGMVIAAPASGLALGSWLAFGLGLAGAAVFAFRASKEDRFLQTNLGGYPEYAAKTRFRLLPGVW